MVYKVRHRLQSSGKQWTANRLQNVSDQQPLFASLPFTCAELNGNVGIILLEIDGSDRGVQLGDNLRILGVESRHPRDKPLQRKSIVDSDAERMLGFLLYYTGGSRRDQLECTNDLVPVVFACHRKRNSLTLATKQGNAENPFEGRDLPANG